jgi:hypothetical protein
VGWAARIASTSDDYGYGIATDPSGNVFVTGVYSAALTLYGTDATTKTLALAGGTYDAFVAKYTSAGVISWAARIASAAYDSGYGIATDSSGNVFVTGYYGIAVTLYNQDGTTGASLANAGGGECFVAKYTSAGVVSWAARIASTGDDNGYGIATDSSGNVFVTGYYSAAVTLYGTGDATSTTLAYVGGNDVFVAKYTSAGVISWAARIVSTDYERGYGIATDSSGNVFVTGYYGAAVTFYGTGDATSKTLAFAGGNDCFVAKYTPAGVISWAARIAGTGADQGLGIATDSSGNVLVTGYYGAALTLYNQDGTSGATLAFVGTYADVFVAKYTPAGVVSWAARIASAGYDGGRGIATDPSGNVFVTGYYGAALTLYNQDGTTGATLAFVGVQDVFVAKYTSAGAISWATRIAGTGDDQGFGIATDSSGNVFVTGQYQAAVTLYNQDGTTGATLAVVGGYDAFVAKYTPNGYITLPSSSINVAGGYYLNGVQVGAVSGSSNAGALLAATGTATGLQGQANLTFNGTTLAVTGNITTTSTTSNSIGGVTLSNTVATIGAATTGSTTAGSVNVAGGYYVNGVQLSGGSAISTYSNAGAVLFATGTSTGLQGSSNLFFSNTSNLGIQTTTPATALDVNGGVTIRNGYRPLYSNVTSTPLTVAANSYGTHFNITTSALTAITLPTIVWASDSNAYWVFRNNTGTYLNITFTYTSAGTTAPANPVTIPPANSVTMMLTYPGGATSNYVLF